MTEKEFEMHADIFQQTGSRHIKLKENCQDVVLCQTAFPICVYGVADGQSGKSLSVLGGNLILNFVADYIKSCGIVHLKNSPYKDEIQAEIMAGIRNLLREQAKKHRVAIEEFSSTLLLLAVDLRNGEYMILHLGDGILLAVNRETDSIRVLSAPENGASLRSTWLTTTEGAIRHFRIYYGNIRYYRRVALMSDGTDSFCRGSRIVSGEAERILIHGSLQDICEYAVGVYLDDSSLIIVDVVDQHVT